MVSLGLVKRSLFVVVILVFDEIFTNFSGRLIYGICMLVAIGYLDRAVVMVNISPY
jgi:hypothetical protein